MSLNNGAAAQVFPAEINLGDLNGDNGEIFIGEAEDDSFGFSVSAAGDINGDGIDDLIIGAIGAGQNGNSPAGRSYVVFGSDTGASNIVRFNGEAEGDASGFSVSAAGDINGDGIDDLIIGANRADPNGNSEAGRSYVVFGSDSGLPNPFNLGSLNGLNGFVINGEAESDISGTSVSAAGDINGDGIDDLIIGASGADPNGNNSGRSYVVFGSDSGLPNPFNLSSLNGLNGFVLNGEAVGYYSGRSVSAAGDINGDGTDDLIIGASGANPNGNGSGRSYVVFGSDSGLPNPFNLSSLNGLNGFVINGEAENDRSGSSVSDAGDINGDGIDDLIIGAKSAGANGNSEAGRSYVVFGSDSGLPNPFNLSSLNGLNGFVINGERARDYSGSSVSAAGDINGDGIDDVIIGASAADSNGNSYSGQSYVVFGSDSGVPNPFNLSSLDGLNGFALNGEEKFDFSGHSVSAAGDFNGDGIDDLIIGAYRADPFSKYDAGTAYVVYGRGDKLFGDRFEGE